MQGYVNSFSSVTITFSLPLPLNIKSQAKEKRHNRIFGIQILFFALVQSRMSLSIGSEKQFKDFLFPIEVLAFIFFLDGKPCGWTLNSKSKNSYITPGSKYGSTRMQIKDV
ncbi:hypothetical protein TNCT_64421 [Trichonephila clavata]|uniref:Uncharacterized protein n=1 Tax=Trichonephila clavata TaxID=2740835 RepID=A0A8X6F164_TRICU|nr:hypothetical protein TNCT_64421 [Trichonephila clavata]